MAIKLAYAHFANISGLTPNSMGLPDQKSPKICLWSLNGSHQYLLLLCLAEVISNAVLMASIELGCQWNARNKSLHADDLL